VTGHRVCVMQNVLYKKVKGHCVSVMEVLVYTKVTTLWFCNGSWVSKKVTRHCGFLMEFVV